MSIANSFGYQDGIYPTGIKLHSNPLFIIQRLIKDINAAE
jgi:hypothetical protein